MHDDAHAHIKKCKQYPKQPCILGCGSAETFKGKDEMSKHLLENCSEMQLTCGKCNEKMIRAGTASHKCEEDLNEVVRRQEQTILELK